jgi:hypothetical protein
MLMSRHHSTGQNHYLKIAYGSFEDVAKFKRLGARVTNENLIHEDIKKRLISGNGWNHSVQNPLPSPLLSRL